ncbi:hypothetical protein [Actinoplanes sp. NPDC049265]|uniref:hypothetical protein n=1 Tax=Actinoplanes sp. NPDC049265 TaxID=3363902 RepID=UPI0037193CC0
MGRRRFGFAALVTTVLCAALVVGAVILGVRARPRSSLPPDPRPVTLAQRLAAAQDSATGSFWFSYAPCGPCSVLVPVTPLSRRRLTLTPQQDARLRPDADRAVAAVIRAETIPPWYCNLLPFCDRDSPELLSSRIRDELAAAGFTQAQVWVEPGAVTFTIERADGCVVGDQYAVIRTGLVADGGGC